MSYRAPYDLPTVGQEDRDNSNRSVLSKMIKTVAKCLPKRKAQKGADGPRSTGEVIQTSEKEPNSSNDSVKQKGGKMLPISLFKAKSPNLDPQTRSEHNNSKREELQKSSL